MFTAILLVAAIQVDESSVRCTGPGSVRTCHTSDGATYIERVVGNRVIRQATDAEGNSWTEYVITEAGGTRTLGQDSSGRSWTQVCSPTLGTRGLNREGRSVQAAPRALPADPAVATSGLTYRACPNTVDEFDTNREAVRALTAREIERRDRRRRSRRRGF
jgi:hypothetical protein